MRSLVLFSAILSFALMTSVNARAGIVVESAGSAMQRNMFVTQDFEPSPQMTSKKQNKSTKDFRKAVASKYFKTQQNAIVLVDLDHAKTSTLLYKGQYLAVRVSEHDDTLWNFENISSNLKFVKKEKRNGVLILLYHTIGTGVANLNFDLMSGQSALFSRILNVRVI